MDNEEMQQGVAAVAEEGGFSVKDVQDALEQGLTTVREMKGISDGEMEAIYALASNFYRTGNYEKAETLFRFLVMFDHLNAKYWMGLGAVRQVQKRFKEAIDAYALVVTTLDFTNVKASFYAAECHLALGDRVNATSAIEHVKYSADVKTEEGRTFLAKAKHLEKVIAAAGKEA